MLNDAKMATSELEYYVGSLFEPSGKSAVKWYPDDKVGPTDRWDSFNEATIDRDEVLKWGLHL